MRIEDEDVDLIETAEGLDGGAAGVAGGRADDRRARAAGLEHVVHQPPEELHRDILEGEGRAMEELKGKEVVVKLHQRADRRMAERGVGIVDHPKKVAVGDLAADERAEHRLGDLARRGGRQRRRFRLRARAGQACGT